MGFLWLDFKVATTASVNKYIHTSVNRRGCAPQNSVCCYLRAADSTPTGSPVLCSCTCLQVMVQRVQTGFVDANVMLRAAHILWVDAFLHNAVSSFDAFLHPLVLSILIYLAESIWLQAQNCLGCTSL